MASSTTSIDLSAPGAVTIRPLTVADRDACVVVENACFTNPDHRATPDKFSYRLTVCPELCLGVFVHTADSEALLPAGSSSSSAAPSSGVMVGHVIATRCGAEVLSDASMGVPKDWRAAVAAAPAGSDAASAISSPLGHQAAGSTVAVHSLGIVPSLQGKGLGTKLMKAYMERMAALSATAGAQKIDRVALICQDYLVDYYTKLGFKNNGPSEAQFGGGGWFDMYYTI
ncbi:hypothetical protein Sste5346_003002 [Sporothrix stenoceras]|uniref:N-acetyltransferase domain-containing protein n=1 Tax=Sporothrix stenoceras TaxID=5173 RepID=A0ABR3ZEH5_9PEZI